MTMFKITTWNVQNLFRPPSSASVAEASRYQLKLQELARSVLELAPDVVALQEVGGEEALTDLQNALGATYDHRALGISDARGICCAFLSRNRFEVSPKHLVELPASVRALGLRELDDQPISRLGRGALHVRVRRGSRTVDLVNVHLKSKLLTFPGGQFSTSDEDLRARVASQALARRAAEAASVRCLVSALRREQRPIVVLGDLNDVPSAATTQILLGPAGSAIGTQGFMRPDAGDPQRLWNVSTAILEPRRFSRVHSGHRELLDQILVSHELASSFTVDARVEGLRSIGDDPMKERVEVWPDHAAVTASFDA